jgi:hypothetical protein
MNQGLPDLREKITGGATDKISDIGVIFTATCQPLLFSPRKKIILGKGGQLPVRMKVGNVVQHAPCCLTGQHLVDKAGKGSTQASEPGDIGQQFAGERQPFFIHVMSLCLHQIHWNSRTGTQPAKGAEVNQGTHVGRCNRFAGFLFLVSQTIELGGKGAIPLHHDTTSVKIGA